jgi:hypothetical protein
MALLGGRGSERWRLLVGTSLLADLPARARAELAQHVVYMDGRGPPRDAQLRRDPGDG